MPAPMLRHYKSAATAGANVDVVPPIQAGRALIISKVTVSPAGTGTAPRVFDVGIDTVISEAGKVAGQVSISLGESWAESGLVMAAGERLWVGLGASNGLTVVNVFGQEVDNG